ncbi:MAG: dimethyl sulfoxide reductase anchor subunit [Acidobacteriota bacterium]|nr:dimethyl sulfoxide reductase anchor subunit [Acidobacteriota bacterium]
MAETRQVYLDELPLMESSLLSTAARSLVQIEFAPRPLIPERPLSAGEQYRFHFDMTKCIGCKCCVVACNEQNGNPAAINWRRVGEVEGGHYPHTQRHYLSMGCNHCLEPSCLIGCPVEAYTKDPATGTVLHSADTCIGCQYCVWNCSYGVPQYNPERGVVGKCDMCHNRLGDGDAPACVGACPEGAIAIEIVNIAEWRRDYLSANAPGLPSADDSISTTRITLPENLIPDAGRVDTQRVEPEHPHWPLVFMLVLTQLSVGAFVVLWLLDLLGRGGGLTITALASLTLAGISLGASTLHLGRPIYAFRALKGLRRSWLSREVLTLSLFAGAASAFAGMLMFHLPGRSAVGLCTALSGLAGVTSSARIYVVRARPAWFSAYTLVEFYSTALLLGPLFVQILLAQILGGAIPSWVRLAAVAGASAQLVAQTLKFLWLSRSEVFELRASSLLLSGCLQNLFLARLAILAIAGVLLPLVVSRGWMIVLAFAMALAGEWLGRYLFFVSVVPKNIAAAFTSGERTAA